MADSKPDKIEVPQVPNPVPEAVASTPETFTPISEQQQAQPVEPVQPVKRKRGRPRKNPLPVDANETKDGVTISRGRLNDSPAVSEETEETEGGADNGGAKALAVSASFCFSGLGCALFGETFAPTPKETSDVSDAFARYFEASGISDVPPGVALIMLLGGLTLSKMADPKCKEAFLKRVSGIKGWISGTRANNRSNRNGQDDSSQADSRELPKANCCL